MSSFLVEYIFEKGVYIPITGTIQLIFLKGVPYVAIYHFEWRQTISDFTSFTDFQVL